MTIIVTGGVGFIGANFVLDWCARSQDKVVVLDKLTYAGNRNSLRELNQNKNFIFEQGDIADATFVADAIRRHQPRAIVNFAAESHVDRSIHGPAEFVQTNIVGTFVLLDVARTYWATLPETQRAEFRFLHVSTDEVYGTLAPGDAAFTEVTRYEPNSPYAASKAASDHLVRAWFHTYGFPVLTTNCSNNYGPFHFPEKLIPLVILNALNGRPLPIYGDGQQIRDWLYVKDHCGAIRDVLNRGRPGETYNIGARNEQTNLDVVTAICRLLNELQPRVDKQSYEAQIAFVPDRLGHDRRYAIDPTKIEHELGWRPSETFESGLLKTVAWYLANDEWVSGVTSGAYREWVKRQYGE